MCKLKRKPSFSPSQSSGDTPVSFNDKQLENYGAEVLYAQPVSSDITSVINKPLYTIYHRVSRLYK